jgi:hypothetical protein
MRRSGIFSIFCGARGPFPAAAAAMVVVLVLFSYDRSEEVLNPPYVVGLNIWTNKNSWVV